MKKERSSTLPDALITDIIRREEFGGLSKEQKASADYRKSLVYGVLQLASLRSGRNIQNLEAAVTSFADRLSKLEEAMQNILDSGASTTDIDKPAPSRPESIFCVIDGDGYSFSLTQFARGVEGGKESLARLQESIYRGLDMWDRKPRPELSIKVFLNKAGLWNLLKYKERREDLSEKTDEFLQGFCKYVPGCDVVDVGRGKEVVDNKVREEIRRAVTNRKYTHIIFGGCHDTGYIPFLETLMREHEDARKMLYLMPAYPIDFAYTALNLPQLKPLDSVFNRRKLGGQYFEREREADSRMSRREPFATRQQLQPWKAFASGLGGDLPSPVGSAFSTTTSRESEPLTLDRSKSIKHQRPKVCSEFYLYGTCNRAVCPWSHDYVGLTDEDMEQIKAMARTYPCRRVNDGPCKNEDGTCLYRHYEEPSAVGET